MPAKLERVSKKHNNVQQKLGLVEYGPVEKLRFRTFRAVWGLG